MVERALQWFLANRLRPTSTALAAVSSGVASCLWHSLDPRRAPLPGVASRGFDPPMHRTLLAVHRPDDGRAASRLLLDVLRQVGELVA